MSNMTLFKGGMPSYLKDAEMDETTKSLMGGIGGGKRISIKGNVFRLIANGEEIAVSEERSMNIIVVKAAPHVTRTFYAGTYKEGENKPPTCWSSDGVKPDPAVRDKQCDTCAKCEQNVKGSGQGESRACRYNRKLAVVLEGDIDGDVYELSVPAQSIFGKADGDKMPLGAYVQYLATHNVPVTAVVTEMRFDLKSPTPKLFFKPLRPLEESEWLTCREQAESPDAVQAVQHTFVVNDEEPEQKKPAAKGFISKPKAKPEPEAAADDGADDETPEPTKVESKKAAPTGGDGDNIDELLEEWGA